MKKVKSVNLVYLITILINIGASFVLSELSLHGIDPFGGSLTLQLIFSQVIFAVPAVIYLCFFSKDYTVLRLKKIGFGSAVLCVILYICVSPVLTFINLLSQLYSHNAISTIMYSVSYEMPFIVGIFLMAAVPAFIEEATYRGLFYNTYREKYPLAAIFLSGLLFGLMHGNLNQFTYAFAFGAVFALIVEATDSLWSTIIVHFLVNFSSTALLYILPKAMGYLQALVDEAKAAGDEMTLKMIESLLGTGDISIEGIMSASDKVNKGDILRMLPGYAVGAVIGGILAFLLYRTIAKKCGRWEHVRGIFIKNKPLENVPVRYTVENNIPEGQTPGAQLPVTPEPVGSPFTWELIVAGVLMLISMIGTELIYSLIK